MTKVTGLLTNFSKCSLHCPTIYKILMSLSCLLFIRCYFIAQLLLTTQPGLSCLKKVPPTDQIKTFLVRRQPKKTRFSDCANLRPALPCHLDRF